MLCSLKYRYKRQKRGGQVVIFLLMAFVALLFLVLWNTDLHRLVTMKAMSQDGGDAAALAAARWQASALNLIGELNFMHALALADGNADAVDAVTNMQARICLTGPLAGLVAAQQAAKQNGIHASETFNNRFSAYLQDIAHDNTIFPAFYPEAKEEYAAMLSAVLADQIAADPPYPSVSAESHILLDPNFYNAIATRDWCWFERNHPTLLLDYTNYTWWPELPPPPAMHELYSLDIRPIRAHLAQLVHLSDLQDRAADADMDLSRVAVTNLSTVETWYYYNAAWLEEWTRLDTDNPMDPFPVVGPAKPEYNYNGIDALATVMTSVQRQTPGLDGSGTRHDAIGWTAAAKPFGFIGTADDREPPASMGLVMPAFRNVRLIPLDASTGDGFYELDMRDHFALHQDGSGHLQIYVATGQLQPNCWYCRQLQTWDLPYEEFRKIGVIWLEEHDCPEPPGNIGGGGGPGAGRGGVPPRIGH